MIIAKELWYELVPLLHLLLVRPILVLQLFVRACAWNTTAIQPAVQSVEASMVILLRKTPHHTD
eukprot:COSAG01_NODE_5301_length_4351_cov_2.957432_3_plen_64_part_00